MALSESDLLRIVLDRLSQRQFSECNVYLDHRRKMAGELVHVALKKVPMPFPGHVVFVDLAPQANWGHPVAYFLVNDENEDTVRLDGQFPPPSDEMRLHFRILAKTAT